MLLTRAHMQQAAASGGGPTEAELLSDTFTGQTGLYAPAGDTTGTFLTNLGQTTVSVGADTVGLALDAHLMGGVAAGEFIDALAKTAVTDWTNNGWDVFSSTGDAFEAEKTGAGGSAWAISNAFLPVVTNNDFFVLEVDVEANTLGGSGGSFSLTSATNTRSTLPDIAAGQTGTVRGIANYTSGTGSPFSISVRTAQLGALEVSSARGAKLDGNHLMQSSSTQRPRFYTPGVRRYDAFDDRLLTSALAGSSGNSIVMHITAPASLASTQVLAGMQADTSTRFYLAINTSGQLCAGVGADGTTVIVGTTDIRGQTGTAALVEDGSTVRLYWNGVEEYSDVQDGSPTTTIPFIEGALNDNGTPASFCGADVHQDLFVDAPLDASLVSQWTNLWS